MVKKEVYCNHCKHSKKWCIEHFKSKEHVCKLEIKVNCVGAEYVEDEGLCEAKNKTKDCKDFEPKLLRRAMYK